MKNSNKNTEKMFRLMNHDCDHEKPEFNVYTVEEHNERFGTNFNSVEEAVDALPEYLYSEAEMKEYLADA